MIDKPEDWEERIWLVEDGLAAARAHVCHEINDGDCSASTHLEVRGCGRDRVFSGCWAEEPQDLDNELRRLHGVAQLLATYIKKLNAAREWLDESRRSADS